MNEKQLQAEVLKTQEMIDAKKENEKQVAERIQKHQEAMKKLKAQFFEEEKQTGLNKIDESINQLKQSATNVYGEKFDIETKALQATIQKPEEKQETAKTTETPKTKGEHTQETKENTNPTPPEKEKNFFEKGIDGIKKDYNEGKYGRIAAKVTGIMAIGRGIKKLRSRMTESDVKESSETNKEPRYKKTRTKVLAFLGLGGLLARKGKDMLSWLSDQFPGENPEKKRDELGKAIAQKLGSERSYNPKNNTLSHGASDRTLEQLEKQGLLVQDKNNTTLGYDIDATTEKIKTFTAKPENRHTDVEKTEDVDITQSNQEVQQHNNEYTTLAKTINTHYINKKYQLGNATNTYEVLKNGVIAPGLMIGHLDRTYGFNTNLILQEGTIRSFIKGSEKDGKRGWLINAPKEIVLNVLKAMGTSIETINTITKSGDVAHINTLIQRAIEKFDDNTPEIVKQYRDEMTAKQSIIIAYLLDVKETYRKLTNDNDKTENLFNKPIHKLVTLAKTDKNLHKALNEPELHEDLLEEYQDIEQDRKDLLQQIDQATTPQEKKEVIHMMMEKIKATGLLSRSVAFDMIRGHIAETDSYIESNILDEVYSQTFDQWINQITILKDKKGPITEQDMNDLRSLTNDFYDTMKAVKTQSHIMQETDTDGSLYTRWSIPIIKAGKKVYQTYRFAQDENGGTSMTALTLGTLAVADLGTKIPRNILFSKRSIIGKVFRISPTRFITKNTAKIGFVYGGGRHLREEGVDRINRFSGQQMSKAGYMGKKYLKAIYKHPDDLIKGIKTGHISLDMAGKIAYDKAGNKWYNELRYSRNTKDTFDLYKVSGGKTAKNMNTIKKTLLEEAYGNRFTDKEIQKLVEYFDHPKLANKIHNVKIAEKILPSLMNDKVDEAINIAKGLRIKNAQEAEKIASEIIESSRSSFIKQQEQLSKQLEKERDKAIKAGKSKAELQKITDKYTKLTEEATEAYNKNIYKQEKTILKQLKKMKPAERKMLYESNAIIKNIIDTNGGLKLLTATKRGRVLKIGTYAAMALWQGGSTKMNGGSRKETGREVADFGIGMVPVAGDLYDIGMAIRGKDLNGKTMSASERWVRGGLGVVCGVANVFTFGLGGTALKGTVKGVVKVGAKMTAKQALKKGLSKEVLKKGSIALGKQALKNGAITLGAMTLLRGAEEMIYEDNIEETETEPVA